MNRILDALRTPSAMLVALLLALVAQLEHTAQVFMQTVNATGDGAQVHAYAFAIAVETAVLLFVLHGHKRISYGFAVATFATNLSYYAMHGVDLTSITGAPAWLMAGLLPAAIVGYSHTIADTPEGKHAAKPAAATQRRRWQFWRKPLESPTTATVGTGTTNAPTATPAQSGGHSEGAGVVALPAEQASETSAAPEGARQVKATKKPVKKAKATQRPTPDQRRNQIAEWQLQSPQQVMDAFGVGKRTADEDLAWVRKNAMNTNGVAK